MIEGEGGRNVWAPLAGVQVCGEGRVDPPDLHGHLDLAFGCGGEQFHGRTQAVVLLLWTVSVAAASKTSRLLLRWANL